MKKILYLFLIFIALLFSKESAATHEAGVDLRYEHLAGNDYRFHFILYRDCSGIPANQSYTITGNSAGGGFISFTVDSDSVASVSQICASETDKCTNAASPYMGIEAWYYHGDVTVPNDSSIWTFGIQPICNRNIAINNLIGGGGAYCTYVETKLNNFDFPDNSSPVFSAIPLFHLCNQVQYLHLYAQDPDGDSLAFEMYTPHSDATIDVNYLAGLSAYQPVTYNFPDSTQFNPLTGDIRFEANNMQVTVVGVRVNEFRNGIFIGSEERDIEVIFDNCTYHAPTASGINGLLNFTAHICADSLFTFHINANDQDGDSVRFSYQNNIPGSSVTLSGVNNNIAHFTWQPQSSDISPIPHVFTLYVTDSVCPYVYFNSYQYSIYVDSCFVVPLASFSSPQNVCEGSCISFTNLSSNASTYQWYFPGSIQDTSTFPDPQGICYPTAGNFDVQLIVTNSSGSDTLLLPNYITVYPAALAQSITFSGDTLFAIQGAVSYQWYLNNSIIAGATDYFYFATANGNYSVVATDINGCESDAIITEVIVAVTPLSPIDEGLRLYPNPVQDKFIIQNAQFTIVNDKAALSIYNVMGEKIISKTLFWSPDIKIDVHGLSPGLYYIEIYSNGKTLRTKFVKE